QAVGRDERALLLHVIAEHAAKRRVQQVRRRMVEANRFAPLAVDRGVEPVADAHGAAGDRADVAERRAELLRILDAKLAAVRAAKLAGVADLTAALGVERRAIEHDGAARARVEPLDGMAVGVIERRDGAVELERLVAVELGRLIERERPVAA